jgi:hypothetical protein
MGQLSKLDGRRHVSFAALALLAIALGWLFHLAPGAYSRWRVRSRGSKGAQQDSASLGGSYWVSLASTAVGVFLALQLNQIEVERSERKQEITRSELEQRQVATADSLRRVQVYHLLVKAHSDVTSLKEEVRHLYSRKDLGQHNMRTLLKATPLRPARGLEVVLETEIVLATLSEESYAPLRNMQAEMGALIRLINGDGQVETNLRASLDVLGMLSSLTQHLLHGEERLLSGVWTPGETSAFRERWQMHELQGDTTHATWARDRNKPTETLQRMRTTIGQDTLIDFVAPRR